MSFLTRLLVHQKCSLTIRASEDGELQGDLLILVRGQPHQLSVQATTIEGVIIRMQYEYLQHDWGKVEVPVVEVRKGVVEVVQGQVKVVDFDLLENGYCPSCEGDLDFPWDIDARECPHCHYAWAEGDE